MNTTIRALLCIALLATYSSCIPIGSVRKKEDFGLPDKIFFPKEGGERIYFAKKRIWARTTNSFIRTYYDDKGFYCVEYEWLTVRTKDEILIVKVEPAPDESQRCVRIECETNYRYQEIFIYQN